MQNRILKLVNGQWMREKWAGVGCCTSILELGGLMSTYLTLVMQTRRVPSWQALSLAE